MSLLEDTAIFTAIVERGGFSHAARWLGISNGLVSRRMAILEKNIGVTLIKRTTRQIMLTPEGEIFYKHTQRIQQELNSALSQIQISSKKPRGVIKISAPVYFGRHYLAPIIHKFLLDYEQIEIVMVLTGDALDPIKEKLDFSIRGTGFFTEAKLEDSGLRARILTTEKVGLYASPEYLGKYGVPQNPEELKNHAFINLINNKRGNKDVTLDYSFKGKNYKLNTKSKFSCNDIATNIATCVSGFGIGKFTELNINDAVRKKLLYPILEQYNWGKYHLYAVYPQQHNLPSRTRLLLEFIASCIRSAQA